MMSKGCLLAVLGLLGGCATTNYIDETSDQDAEAGLLDTALFLPEADSGDAGPQQAPLFVDHVFGLDTNACTEDEPCQTITRAASLSHPGQTIYVARGTYSLDSGEAFPIPIPSGVTIEGLHVGQVFLYGVSSSTPFEFAGDATLRNLVITEFPFCVQSNSGTVRLVNMELLSCATGAIAQRQGHIEVENSMIRDGTNGFYLEGQAELSVKMSTITGIKREAVAAWVNSQVTLTHMTISLSKSALHLHNQAKVVMNGGNLFKNGSSGASVSPQVTTEDQSTLIITYAAISESAGTAMSLHGETNIVGGGVDKPIVQIDGHLTINGTTFTGSSTLGIWADQGMVELTNVRISNRMIGVRIEKLASLKLHDSWFSDNQVALSLFGCKESPCDLGWGFVPGNNHFDSPDQKNLWVQSSGEARILARGNHWIPSVQGADANGNMPSREVTGPYTEPGNNFQITSAGPTIAF